MKLASLILAAVLHVLVVAPPAAHRFFRFVDPAIVESSGVASSSASGSVFFTHNDSGDSARFFAVSSRGCTVGVFDLAGATAVDWEDMARVGSTLYLGDIGDNDEERATVDVYRVAEPAVGTCAAPVRTSVPYVRLSLRYADGPHNAETLLVWHGQLYVVTKGGSAALYRASGGVLRRVASVPRLLLATAGDIHGSLVAVRDYSDIYVWRIPASGLAHAFASPPVYAVQTPDAGEQGEGLAFSRDGRALITTAEGVGSRSYRIVLRP